MNSEKAGKIIIATYCLINKDGKYLLTKEVGKEGWKLPGGKLNEGETVLEAVTREVEEEVGLKVKIDKLIQTQEYLSNEDHRIRIFFTGEYVSGEIMVQENEIDSIAWLSVEELKNLRPEDFFKDIYFLPVKDFISKKFNFVEIIR